MVPAPTTPMDVDSGIIFVFPSWATLQRQEALLAIFYKDPDAGTPWREI
jgi:hypothetical protein